MRNRSVVVLPTYNEAANLAPLVERLYEWPVDVLVVDDGSPDGTGELADGLAAASQGRLAALHRPGKMGLGSAYLLGFRHALAQDYERIFEMDCDFSHDPAYVPALLRETQEADLALGSRYVPGGGTVNWGLPRRLISRFGSAYAGAILRLPYRDLTGGFKCFRRSVLEALDLAAVRSNGYGFQIELTYRAHQRGFRIVEVPIVFQERRAGASKMSRSIITEAMLMVWRIKFGA
ncbi:MAG TPA: polyprenol monophosphomannose synthase [Chloroflexota bacterium]|nr:polyprenol monophosphomannose synthase [Chloroflexota bacterium]